MPPCRRQAMVAAKLSPDGIHVVREQREELLQVEIAQPRRQGLLTDETKGKRGHGIGQRRVGGQCTPATGAGSVPPVCGRCGVGLKPAWMLGFRRKRTNLHEKYDYPVFDLGRLR